MRNCLEFRKRLVYLRLVSVFVLTFFFATHFTLAVFAVENDKTRETDIKESIDKILTKNEFSYNKYKDNILESIGSHIKEVVELIVEKVKKLLNLINMPQQLPEFKNPITENSAKGLKITGVLIICLIITALIFLLLRNFRISKKLKIKEDFDLISTLKDPDLMEQQAFEYSKKGEFRFALRFLYLGLLLRLNELNLIKINKSKSNRQYLHELRSIRFEGYELIEELTDDFNRYWYGNRNLDIKSYEFIYKIYTSIAKEAVK